MSTNSTGRPTARRCVAIAAQGSGDNHWYIAQLYVLAMATGEMISILDPKMQVAVPRWSPDGRTIAFIGGLMSDEGVTGGDIYLVPATGGKTRNLTPALEGSPSWLAWQDSSRSILFAEHLDGGSGLARVDLDGKVTQLWKGDERIAATGNGPALSVSASRDQATLAVIRHSFRQPPEIWVGATDRWRAITHANRMARPDWGEATSLHWKSDDFEIQGWILAPRDLDPARRYPLIVVVHGGPSSAFSPSWLGADSFARDTFPPGLLRPAAQSARQLRARRAIHAGQCQGLRLRRPPRHPQGRRRGGEDPAGGWAASRDHRLELRRLHDHVGGHADRPLQRRGCRGRIATGRATTGRTASTSG